MSSKTKQTLHLADIAPKLDEQPPAEPATEAEVTPLPTVTKVNKIRHKPAMPSYADRREFTFPDGRPIIITKHAVIFFCPLKDEPETGTLVGIKGTANPVPLAIPYPEFKAWIMRD